MRKTKIILIFLLFLFIPLFLLAPLEIRFLMGFAQEVKYPEIPGAPTPGATTTFPAFVKYIFNFVMMVSGLIGFAVLVWGGILYLTSGGDAAQLSEARNKIVRAGIGLTILLSSYLILSIINPELTFFTLESTKPTTGIYLIDKDGKKFYVRDTFSTTTVSYMGIEKVEFISASSSLRAVYLYNDENYEGIEERVINYKIAGVLTVSEPKSIYFLGNDPGIYLCSTTTSEDICPSKPIYAPHSIKDLSQLNFDDKTRSIQINNRPDIYYGALLFEKPGYVSDNKCPYVYYFTIPDLDKSEHLTPGGEIISSVTNNPSIGRDKLSSIIVYSFESGREVTGTVIFFDDVGCLPGASSTEVDILSSIWGKEFGVDWDKKVKSLKIKGSAGVLLTTGKPNAGHCQFFTPEDTDEKNCINNLPPEIFETAGGKGPSSFMIVPYFQ